MRLLGVDLGGFRSFVQDASFDVGKREPGLYSVTGANGSGKSTLFESVFWCLFGRTSRGLKAGSIKSWPEDAQSPLVVTSWADERGAEGVIYVVRSWQPNKLLIGNDGDMTSDRPVEQDALEEFMHITPSAFLHSCYFAQITPSFVDLSAPEQSAIFTDVLGLRVWETASETAKMRADELEEHLANFKSERDKTFGKLEALAGIDFEHEEQEWGQVHLLDVKDLENKIAALEPEQLALHAQVELSESKLSEYGAYSKKANSLEGLIGICGAKVRELVAEIKDLERDDYKNCPTCGAPVTNSHVKKELKRVRKAHAAEVAKLEKAKEDHTQVLLQMKPFANQLTKRDDAKRKLAVNEQQQIMLTAQLKKLKREVNPYTAQREEADRQGEELAAKLDELDQDIKEITAEIGYNKYWIQGFKELRLSVIRESLDQLTVETNECLFQLGLPDWSIEFDVEHETKSGSVRKNFTTFINAPGAPEAVPWEAWSGGESQRLRLAIAMGFSNLICSRSGVTPNFEFWDEPSTWCDDIGIDDMLSVLADRAERYDKRIFLADHRALDFGGFAGTIKVTKDSKGSHIDG